MFPFKDYNPFESQSESLQWGKRVVEHGGLASQLQPGADQFCVLRLEKKN